MQMQVVFITRDKSERIHCQGCRAGTCFCRHTCVSGLHYVWRPSNQARIICRETISAANFHLGLHDEVVQRDIEDGASQTRMVHSKQPTNPDL